jgi:hypothetical protein
MVKRMVPKQGDIYYFYNSKNNGRPPLSNALAKSLFWDNAIQCHSGILEKFAYLDCAYCRAGTRERKQGFSYVIWG